MQKTAVVDKANSYLIVELNLVKYAIYISRFHSGTAEECVLM